MIMLKIKNELVGQVLDNGVTRLPQCEHDEKVYKLICDVKPYDMEKWKDGRIYEFDTLREVVEFIDTCDIALTDEAEESFYYSDWYEVNTEYHIDLSEDNLIIFNINVERCYQD